MEVASVVGKFFIFSQIWMMVMSFDSSGFLFTAPRTFLAGHDENVCITFKHPSNIAEVRIKLLKQKEDVEIASAVEKITDVDYEGKCFKIFVPKTQVKKGRLRLTIHLKTDPDFSINYVEQIFIQSNPDITFIQTDKPVYNGGQLLRFRIFMLRPDLTPVKGPIDKIWIENPSGIQLAQWLNESTNYGVVNKTFQLSKEPMLGKWFIKMKKENDDVISQSFLVENYILPKFSVTIKCPDYLNTKANITICAKYHFNEPVRGNVILQYFIECSFTYYCQENKASVIRNLKLDQNGCVDHEITIKNLSSFAQNVLVNASVIEEGTRMRAKAVAKMSINNLRKKNVMEFSVETKKRKFKPGLPFKGEILMKSPLTAQEKIFVCLDSNEMQSCKEVFEQNSRLKFLVLPLLIANENNFKVAIEIRNSSDASFNYITKLNLIPWYSPSGSYLQLENLSDQPLQCNQNAKFNVLYSSLDSSVQFHYMIRSRGVIISKGNLDAFSALEKPFQYEEGTTLINNGDLSKVKEFEFDLSISSIMSPRLYLVVYFIRNDGEIVADTLSLPVEKCLPNIVKTKWATNITSPGSDNNFLIQTSSNSFCALTITDKSVHLLSTPNNVNLENTFKELKKFEVTSDFINENFNNHCKGTKETKDDTLKKEMEFLTKLKPMDSQFVDSLQAFNDFGALVITDLNLETRPCRVKEEEENLLIENKSSRNSRINVTGNEVENLEIFEPEEFFNHDKSSLRESELAYDLRTFFPETWIWDFVPTDDSGTANLKLEVPHTITEWVTSTVCLSKENGLGIANNANLITYQPFFLDFVVPQSLNRKEILYLEVSVFNYESIELPVKITYYPSASFILKSKTSKIYCIRSKTKIVHRFVLEAAKLGEAQILVKAEIDGTFSENCGNVILRKSDSVLKKTTIKHEGFPMENVKSGFICGESSNFDHEVDWTIQIPAEAIESTISADILVSGDILGPSLQNIANLIMLPTGCGEQNMILLVPNILLLDYLLLIKAEDVEPIENALKNLDLGYQRQLNYKRSDGSYSAFGEQDEKGSIWLTAFVVRYLSQAKKYIYMDSKNLNSSVAWIIKQQLENGCFPMIGKVYHRSLQDKLMEEDSSKTLTAYILISLIEAGIPKDHPVIKNAIYCLKPTQESLGMYGDLLSAYAFILAGEYRESQALMLELMEDAKRSYGMLWWESDDSIESAIEMTGYGILTLVKLGGPRFLAAASYALRWIIQYQNQNGGFISSQDTVLALEAISKFSATLPRTGDHDQLTVKARALDEVYTFNISNNNKMLQQKVTLPSFLMDVHFESTGKGCALVQTHLHYNVRRKKPNNDLKIQLRIHSVSDVDSYSIAKFHICVRYKAAKSKINMAVLEVAMVSGYYPDRASLYEIRTSRRGIQRWEEYEDKVNFYLEDLRSKKICVKFLVTQEVCVENTAPAIIKLYDYYNTKLQTTMKYNFMPKCNNSSRIENAADEIKSESKRELRYTDEFIPMYNPVRFDDDRFSGFVDFEPDLETPPGIGGVMPVYALPPNSEGKGLYCAHCQTIIPKMFPQLYCSSQIAIKVLILSKQTIEFYMDVSPRSNFMPIKRTVSFTMRPECECSTLNLVNSYALLLVTPPRSFNVHYVQEIHMDDSVQLYPWGDPNDVPKYLIDALPYCREWLYSNNY